jgi:hypothetical protein
LIEVYEGVRLNIVTNTITKNTKVLFTENTSSKKLWIISSDTIEIVMYHLILTPESFEIIQNPDCFS